MDWEFAMASGGLLVKIFQCIDKQPRGIATLFFTLGYRSLSSSD